MTTFGTGTGNGGAQGHGARAAVPLSDTALRLVIHTKMYDAGTLVAHSPALGHLGLAHLVESADVDGSVMPRVALHPEDLDHLGARTGTLVELVAAGGRLRASAVGDPGVLRGTAAVVANAPGTPVNGLGASGAPTPIIDVHVEVIR